MTESRQRRRERERGREGGRGGEWRGVEGRRDWDVPVRIPPKIL